MEMSQCCFRNTLFQTNIVLPQIKPENDKTTISNLTPVNIDFVKEQKQLVCFYVILILLIILTLKHHTLQFVRQRRR